MHDQPQLVPLQVGVEFEGPAAHGVHDVPQLLTEVLSAHVVEHWWNPELQAKVQALLTHSGCPFATLGQTLPQPLQFCGSLVLSTQVPLQSVGFDDGQPLTHA